MTRRSGARVLLALVTSFILACGTISVASAATYKYAAPTGLDDYDKTNTTITLTWKRTSGLNRYAIQYSTSSSFSNPKYRVPDGVNTQAKAVVAVHDLQPNKAYYFRIRSTYADGRNASDWSKSLKVSTSSYAFSPPARPAAKNLLSSSADLTWGEVPNAGAYRIQYSTSSTWAGAQYSEYTDNLGKLTGLTPGKKYYLRVRALESKTDETGAPYPLTDYSATSTLTTPTTFTTTPPAGLELVSSSKDKIVLRWSQSSGANEYRLQQWVGSDTRYRYLNSYDIPSGATGTKFTIADGKVTATVTKFCDSNGTCNPFVAGSTYTFRVTAMSGEVRISDYTALAGTKAVATSFPLSTPNAVTVVGTTSSSITLSWQAVPGATSYRLQQKKGSTSGETRYLYDVCRVGGGGSPVTCNRSGDTISVTLTKFQNNNTNVSSAFATNTAYYFRVTAQVPTGTPGSLPDADPTLEDRASEYTTSYAKATTAKYPFNPPPLQTVLREKNAITLAWARGSGSSVPKAFIIDRSKDTEFKKIDYTSCLETSFLEDQADNPVGGTTWQRRYYNLTAEQSYFFRIRVVNNCTSKTTQSDLSAPISARTTSGLGTLTGKVVKGEAAMTSTQYNEAVSAMVATAYVGTCASSTREVADAVRVSSDGEWALDSLRAGSYCVLLSQIGGENATSPWAYTGAVWNDERHKFKAKASTYTVTAGGVRSVGDVAIGRGQTLTGTVRSGVTPLKDVSLTAIAAPVAPADLTREVQDVATTKADGTYEFVGLFPGKYKFSLTKSGYKASSFWVNPLAAHPTIDATLCGTSATGCTPTPTSTQYNS